MKKLLGEIRQDILIYDFNYMEYEKRDGIWEKCLIVDGDQIIWYYSNEKGFFTGRIEKDRFVTLNEKAVMEMIASDHYYNFIEWEE